MTTLRTAAQQALEALEIMQPEVQMGEGDAAIKALRTALAEPVQEPVAWIDDSGHPKHLSHLQSATERRLYGPLRPLYTAPPKPLTEEEIRDLLEAEFLGRDGKRSWDDDLQVFRLAERAHGIT